MAATDMAFDAPSDADDDAAVMAPSMFLEDHSADPALLLEHQNYEENNNQQLAEAMSELDERARDILAQRWLVEEKATLHELAAKYEVSAERIRQIEKNAMKKLKNAIMIV